MNLIIDTSAEQLVVIANSGSNWINANENNVKHLKHLLPQIDKLLISAKKDISDIEKIGIVCGPGSFTGVRIGISTVKGFLCAYPKIKVVALNKFDILANKIIKATKINTNLVIIIKSTSTKFYYAYCSKEGKILEMGLKTNSDISSFVQEENAPLFCFNGDGLNTVQNPCSAVTLCDADYIEVFEKEKNIVDINNIKPLYLALSQAEEELLKKEKNDKSN